jgi:hypothetical protein
MDDAYWLAGDRGECVDYGADGESDVGGDPRFECSGAGRDRTPAAQDESSSQGLSLRRIRDSFACHR